MWASCGCVENLPESERSWYVPRLGSPSGRKFGAAVVMTGRFRPRPGGSLCLTADPQLTLWAIVLRSCGAGSGAIAVSTFVPHAPAQTATALPFALRNMLIINRQFLKNGASVAVLPRAGGIWRYPAAGRVRELPCTLSIAQFHRNCNPIPPRAERPLPPSTEPRLKGAVLSRLGSTLRRAPRLDELNKSTNAEGRPKGPLTCVRGSVLAGCVGGVDRPDELAG
jgi:hypothetical protein